MRCDEKAFSLEIVRPGTLGPTLGSPRARPVGLSEWNLYGRRAQVDKVVWDTV